MEYSIDSFYSNGKLHGHKGEDYALHGEDYFIICDGCSSSNYSDVVSRIQAHTALKFLDSFKNSTEKGYEIITRLIGLRVKSICIDLCIESMPLATLMIGIIVKDILKIIIIGDGAITYKDKGHQEEYINITYSNNAPFYPYYYSDNKLINEYKKYNPNVEKKVSYKYTNVYNSNSDIESLVILDFILSNLEYLYIFSDGIEEFTGQIKLPIKETIKAFTSMKNTNGTFIQRRCKRQLKIYEKEGIFPIDDFSMAGVYL